MDNLSLHSKRDESACYRKTGIVKCTTNFRQNHPGVRNHEIVMDYNRE